MIAESLFWLCLSLVAYTYCLYPCVLFLFYVAAQIGRDIRYLSGRRDRRIGRLAGDLPSVTLIIPVFNEEQSLPDKIENCHSLDYPSGRLSIVCVSDGSTDDTNRLLAGVRHPCWTTVILERRGGKAAALNAAVYQSSGSILVFSDSSTMLAVDALRKLARHFADPCIGAACGALRFQRTDESRQTEGVYWRYESLLRLMEGRLGATLTASGALYAIRRECFLPFGRAAVLDDFITPMNVRKRGYRVIYDPEATAMELAASTVAGEFRRRVRLAVGSYRALPVLVRSNLDAITWFAFVSHKLLRWCLPFLLIGMLVANLFLLDRQAFQAALVAQFLLLGWSGLGATARTHHLRLPFVMVGYFLSAMHLAFLVGFFQFLRGREEATWQRVR